MWIQLQVNYWPFHFIVKKQKFDLKFVEGFWVPWHVPVGQTDHLGQPAGLHQSRGAPHHQPHPARDAGQGHQQEEQRQEEEEEEEEEEEWRRWGGDRGRCEQVAEGPQPGHSQPQQRAAGSLALWRPQWVHNYLQVDQKIIIHNQQLTQQVDHKLNPVSFTKYLKPI